MENSAPLSQPHEDEFRGGDELTSTEDLKEEGTTPTDYDQDGRVSRQDADLVEELHRRERDDEDEVAPVVNDDQS